MDDIAVKGLFRLGRISGSAEKFKKAVRVVIKQAKAEERERCASIMEHLIGCMDSLDYDIACRDGAEAIRKGG